MSKNFASEPLARIPKRYDNNAVENDELDKIEILAKLQRRTRCANLGVFTGYRIGLDLGNGNIGWCILFERGHHLYFLTAEDIAAHNKALSEGQTRTQLPDLSDFVPLGTHKFEARENQQKGERSYSKIRADVRAKERLLDARQRRKLHVKRALQDAGLLPKQGECYAGHAKISADILRVRLLDPKFEAHPHDLGRALYNALKRRGYMKPVGRAGENEGSQFAKSISEAYNNALIRFGCRTVGEFLEHCASDARNDGKTFRKRHQTLAWQNDHRKEKPKEDAEPKSYEAFRFLTPTLELIRDEARTLRSAQIRHVQVSDEDWACIEAAAEFRRSLKAKPPGRCRWFRDEHRCIRALPSFQKFRILEQIENLRDIRGRQLSPETKARAREILESREKVSLAELARELDIGRLKFDKGDHEGNRSLAGARTDTTLRTLFGKAWTALKAEEQDKWVMRFLRRKPVEDGKPKDWSPKDTELLERDADSVFGSGALRSFDDEAAKEMEDKFASLSLKAARVLAECYKNGLNHDQRMQALIDAGAKLPELEVFERLPYYGRVMPDQTVPADGYAPPERTCQDEQKYGRATNPDVHVVMNRLRVVVNEIIEMMGGILPTTCVVEVARSALTEDEAYEYKKKADERRNLHEAIVKEIDAIFSGLGKSRPIGPSLDKLVDRWKAAMRQGWRDYDGNEIQRSALVDSAAYQLDHVSPAAFGDSRQNNIFVSRFNQQKGRRLPWKAAEQTFPGWRPALLAFAEFGWCQRRDILKEALRKLLKASKPNQKRKKGLEEGIERAEEMLRRLEQVAAETSEMPRPDVLNALRRSLKDKVADERAAGEEKGKKGLPDAFSPFDQAALFCKFHPDTQERESGFQARDVPNIGWSTKLALRYLQNVGAKTVPIKPRDVYALRCMFDINKHRPDLRNHAVDAFFIAHFDSRVLIPAFNQLSGHFEEIYTTRALEFALAQTQHGGGFFDCLSANVEKLDQNLKFIATAHRKDHRWNPGDPDGAGLSAFGGENIYSFRPTNDQRKELAELIAAKLPTLANGRVLNTRELLDFALSDHQDKLSLSVQKQLRKNIKLTYRDRVKGKIVSVGIDTALQLGKRNAFINAEAKFSIVGPSESQNGTNVLATTDLLRMSLHDRETQFPGDRIVFRKGDTIVTDEEALVVTGLQADRRLITYPIDASEREPEIKRRPTIQASFLQQSSTKVQSDVLGRRLHKLRKNPGGLKPVCYPLRGQ